MKVLVVVDMQNDFIDGVLGTDEAQAIVPLVAETIEQMASKDTIVIFTKDTHNANYMDTMEGKNLPVPHCVKGTYGHEISNLVMNAYLRNMNKYRDPCEVAPFVSADPIIIEKPTFGSTDLQNMLYAIDDLETVEEVTLMGVCTGICVLSNTILAKATLPEAQINVVADCCACVTPRSHKIALEAMELCQIGII